MSRLSSAPNFAGARTHGDISTAFAEFRRGRRSPCYLSPRVGSGALQGQSSVGKGLQSAPPCDGRQREPTSTPLYAKRPYAQQPCLIRLGVGQAKLSLVADSERCEPRSRQTPARRGLGCTIRPLAQPWRVQPPREMRSGNERKASSVIHSRGLPILGGSREMLCQSQRSARIPLGYSRKCRVDLP